MTSSTHFISCDWGTTNFRLRLVKRETLEILGEYRSDFGVKRASSQALSSGQDIKSLYASFLLETLRTEFFEFFEMPVVCSGMLSSTLGMQELPYAKLPLHTSGKDLITKKIKISDEKKVLLISGASSQVGFMRGEETQAIGLTDYLDNDGILILPGTHSKHLVIKDDHFTEIVNFMTGELFELLTTNSILSATVVRKPWSEESKEPFLAGVEVGLSGKLMRNLLLVRAKQLIDDKSSEGGYFFLSGMLIGDEISSLDNHSGKIYLAAATDVFPLYKTALEAKFSTDRLVFFSNAELLKALFSGQRKMLERYGW